jgi:hypothetical protein
MEAQKTGDLLPRSLVPLLIGVILIPGTLGSSATIFNDGDVSWHIATGRWILDHGTIPHTDPFSFTWAGQPWVPFEWLSEVILAGSYRLAGYSGVAALATAAMMALHAIVFFNAARFVRPWAVVGGLIAMDAVLVPMMLARPHLLAWVLIAFWTWLMLRAREQERAPPLAAALLMVIWTNLHGSFVLGLLIAGAFGMEALLGSSDRRRVLRQWLPFGIACVIAMFVNANGFAGVVHPFLVAKLSHLPLIDEWKPSNPTVTPFFFAVLAGSLLLIWLKRPRMHPVRWLLLGAFLALAFFQMRHQAVLAIVAAMLLPEGLAKAGRATGERRPVLAITAGAIAVLVAIRAALPVTLPHTEANPWKLIAAVPKPLRAEPVLNGYVMGGPLILSGIRPYVDGRSDMYGDQLIVDYKRITEGDRPTVESAVQRWNIRWAILPLRYRKLIALLDHSPQWRRIYADEVGAIYVRN